MRNVKVYQSNLNQIKFELLLKIPKLEKKKYKKLKIYNIYTLYAISYSSSNL